MMRGRLLFVLWCSNILAVARSTTGNPCVTDFFKNITCAWNITSGPLVQSKNSSLRFMRIDRSSGKNVSCPIVATHQSYMCTCAVSDGDIAEYFIYNIKLCNESACQDFQHEFQTKMNIKLAPPPEVELQQLADSISITFKTDNYEKDHMYFPRYLEYEVLLQETHSSWFKTYSLSSSGNLKTIHSDRSQLKTNTEYCIKARFKVNRKGYLSTWSDWNKPICWTNQQKEDDIVPILLKSLAPVCITVGILLFVFYNPATRMKIKTLAHTPTPAPFFKPLFQQHEGNLQEWLSPPGKYVLTYQIEEDIIPDTVTVVPKSNPKDLEENQIFLTTPATQLVFPLSCTSYVGLPGMDKASSPIPVVSPGDTPYTRLPCSVWGFSIQEEDVILSDPKDFLDISHSDSGCSCDNLTRSPECSLPCSPVDEIPTPSHCSDYCILRKTAEGVVPLLLTKQNPGEVPSHSLKSNG